MDAVVLSFPGHFFQTNLCLRSLQTWFDVDHVNLILDDIEQDEWSSYKEDFASYLQKIPELSYTIYRTSDLPLLHRCASGWWRQQLVKLTLDEIIPGDRWFVVDGDVIFDRYCDIENVTPISSMNTDPNQPLEVLTANYVKTMLGVEQGYFIHQNRYSLTNTVPFRWLDRTLLKELRTYVESRFNKAFVPLHLDWFDDQIILAYEDPPQHMNMTEWELIEHYRHQIRKETLPLIDIGPGHPLPTNGQIYPAIAGDYSHGYVRDTHLDPNWFISQGLDVVPEIWQCAKDWQKTHR